MTKITNSLSLVAAHRKEKPLARLDKITADELRRKQRWQKSQQSTPLHTVDKPLSNTTPVEPLHTPPLPFQNNQGGLLLPVRGEGEMMEVNPREGRGEEMATGVAANMVFDDEDSDEGGSER